MAPEKLRKIIWIVAAALVAALVFYSLFTMNMLGNVLTVMSIGFIAGVPFCIGAFTIFLCDVKLIAKRRFVIWMSIAPILTFFLLTLALAMEGWACWLMILPFFLALSVAGGLVMARIRLKNLKDRMYMSFFALLPFAVAPVEQAIASIPGRYTADTAIEIKADKAVIWSLVTRVKKIEAAEDKGWFTRMLGFPRPLEAELDYEGTGAFRKAVFDKGLVFDEKVTAYQHQRFMQFTIRANPYDIPSTTMDEHIVVGGKYFDVLDGTYELQPLANNTYRLHLYSHYKLSTSFNFYASWWAGWIMKDIQNNILQVIKKRAEQAAIVKR